MPQIEQLTAQSWYLASQIFWILVTFGALYFIVGRGMFPKVRATVDTREARVTDDLAAAKAAHGAADAAEASYRERADAARAEAQRAIAEAKAKAAADTAARMAEGDASNQARLAEAEAAIHAARSSAMAEIEHVAVDATRDLVGRLSGVQVDDATVSGAVREVLPA